jgi:thioredoxin-dependent peroxiredoxin
MAGGMLKPGDEAPDFVEQACDGTTVRLRDLRGKRVLLWFYPRADTPG